MKETVFHEIYYSIKKYWDGWLLGTITTILTIGGVYWLSTIYDLNPINWLSALADYAYTRGGPVSFIVLILCLTSIAVALVLAPAWKGRQTTTEIERGNIRKALGDVGNLQTEMQDLRKQLNGIQETIDQVRDILETTD